jgi:hypothetical protein
MIGNTNGLGLVDSGIITPVRAKWFNDGTQELLLQIDESGRPVNEEFASWVKGKISGKHPRLVEIQREKVLAEQKEKEAKSA